MYTVQDPVAAPSTSITHGITVVCMPYVLAALLCSSCLPKLNNPSNKLIPGGGFNFTTNKLL